MVRGAHTIFVTWHPDEATRTQALAAGAVAFLSKPFRKKAMHDCLKVALIRHETDILHHTF